MPSNILTFSASEKDKKIPVITIAVTSIVVMSTVVLLLVLGIIRRKCVDFLQIVLNNFYEIEKIL